MSAGICQATQYTVLHSMAQYRATANAGYTGGIAPIVHIVLHSRRTLSSAAKRHGTDQFVVWPGSGKQGAAASGRIPDRQRSARAPLDADRVRHGW